jgi:hypothetical protein
VRVAENQFILSEEKVARSNDDNTASSMEDNEDILLAKEAKKKEREKERTKGKGTTSICIQMLIFS